jgi:hypothetical protein
MFTEFTFEPLLPERQKSEPEEMFNGNRASRAEDGRLALRDI